MDQNNFNKLVDEIISRGYDEKTATHFSMLIGDAPITDNEGNIIVMENNNILAKLKLNFFSKEKSDV